MPMAKIIYVPIHSRLFTCLLACLLCYIFPQHQAIIWTVKHTKSIWIINGENERQAKNIIISYVCGENFMMGAYNKDDDDVIWWWFYLSSVRIYKLLCNSCDATYQCMHWLFMKKGVKSSFIMWVFSIVIDCLSVRE
jgi:hypothetical protein